MAVRTKRRMISRKKKTKAQILMEQMKRKKLEEPKRLGKYGRPLVNIKQNLSKLTRDQTFNLLERVSHEASEMRRLSNEDPTIWREYRAREEALIPFQRKVSERTAQPFLPPVSQAAKRAKAALRHQRKRAIKGSRDIIAGKLPDSSWISELTYDTETQKVHTIFEGRKYTFWNVPETLFNAWYAGAAATTTADKKKRWNLHDFPSLGAFFNQRIKNKFKYSRGWL